MKKILLIITLLICYNSVKAEDSIPVTTIKCDTTIQNITVNMPKEAEQIYKIYPTQNSYNFLLLNTVDGTIDIVQWSTTSSKRFKYTLSSTSRLRYYDEEIPGRFELYPTSNIYNFILLDKISGRTWQVQWSFEINERMVVPIY